MSTHLELVEVIEDRWQLCAQHRLEHQCVHLHATRPSCSALWRHAGVCFGRQKPQCAAQPLHCRAHSIIACARLQAEESGGVVVRQVRLHDAHLRVKPGGPAS